MVLAKRHGKLHHRLVSAVNHFQRNRCGVSTSGGRGSPNTAIELAEMKRGRGCPAASSSRSYAAWILIRFAICGLLSVALPRNGREMDNRVHIASQRPGTNFVIADIARDGLHLSRDAHGDGVHRHDIITPRDERPAIWTG